MWKRLIELHMIRSTLAWLSFLEYLRRCSSRESIIWWMTRNLEYLSHCKSWNVKFRVETFQRVWRFFEWNTLSFVTTMHLHYTHISTRYPKICMYQRRARNGVLYKWISMSLLSTHPCLNLSILWHLGKKHLFYSLIAHHIYKLLTLTPHLLHSTRL